MKNPIRSTVYNPIVRRAGMAGAVFLATISNAFATGTGGFPWDGAIIQLQSDLIPSTSRNATSNV